MFFILAFGFTAVYGAARFFWRGEPSLQQFSRWMMRPTGFSAAFGFFVGMIHVAGYQVVHAKNLDERVALVIEGTG